MTHDELVIRRGNANGQTGSLPPAKAIKVNESKMAYDELLAKIAACIDGIPADYGQFDLVDALNAVVELAGKDIEHESYAWLDGYDYAMKQIIQAIEKELK